jgi:hypothetical protein
VENEQGCGSKVIDQLSANFKSEFPELEGLSSRNFRYMRTFFENWPGFAAVSGQNVLSTADVILQQPVAKLPWGQHYRRFTNI